MPLFDFHCRHCDATFELLVRSSDTPACPTCGRQDVEKLVSAPAAPGKSASIVQGARAQAAREGHFSNYSKAERAKIK